MKLSWTKIGLAGAAALTAGLLLAEPSWAQAAAAAAPAAPPAPPAPVPNKGDTAWMLVSTALVLMMSVPGLALFYGELVRTKNMLSVLTQVFMIVSIVALLWCTYGYSMAFNGGDGASSPFVGTFAKALLRTVTSDTTAATFSAGVVIPEYVYVAFQMTFACITPALIVGALAERVKFSALMVFMVLWVTVVYFPIAHMVWYWDGPDAFLAAGKQGQSALDAINAKAGYLFQMGALDFAGGTVVHINAGIAGFVGALYLGKRVGYGKEAMPPHSLTMTMIGASLLWVGWFGFNAGSNLEANGVTGVAFLNTFVATAAAAVSWTLVEQVLRGKPSLLGAVSGAVAGLVAVTPASGYAGPMGSIVLGLIVSPICYLFTSTIKNRFRYDDSLDVFGVHGVAGMWGTLATGLFFCVDANPALRVANPALYTAISSGALNPVWGQLAGIAIAALLAGGGTAAIMWCLRCTLGVRVTADDEAEGLDLSQHGEEAYNDRD